MHDRLPILKLTNSRRERSAGNMTFAILLLPLIFAANPARAQQYTESVLYTFPSDCSLGCDANQGLIQDSGGNLYGTTKVGGTQKAGTAFWLDTKGALTVLHNFAGKLDGGNPFAGLIMDQAGNLYGTTAVGGKYGYGTVFKITKGGHEVVLHSFGNGTDGSEPWSGLVMDASRNLYGTTIAGGRYNGGTVFKITAAAHETIMHSFGNGADGNGPLWETLVLDKSGNLYGTTQTGGTTGFGVVFKLGKNGAETILYDFGFTDSHSSDAGLFRDGKGNLYGTAFVGGRDGNGTIYRITGHQETILHSFTGQNGDGDNPLSGLVGDEAGNLYGTTYYGGMNKDCFDGNQLGCGTVFKLDTHRKETILYEFTGGADGAYPGYGNLLRDAQGNLYGATYGYPSGVSLIFKLAPKR
jgi:uncharacterized repeat protein (TIGR03803 family)